MLRIRFRTAAGAFTLFLLIAGATGGRLSAESQVATQATTIHFSLSASGHRALSKGRELVRASGSGTLTLPDTPQINGVSHATSATGKIVFHRWRVVAHRVIDEENVTTNVDSGFYRFTKTTSTAVVEVSVAKTDAKEKDICPAGTGAEIGMLDGRIKSQPDDLSLKLCLLHDVDYGGVKGRRATVAITVKQQPS